MESDNSGLSERDGGATITDVKSSRTSWPRGQNLSLASASKVCPR